MHKSSAEMRSFMNKDEILAKSRKENQGQDEMERQIKDRSMTWTYLAMVIAAATFSFIRGEQGYPVMDLCATVSISVCVNQFYRFIKGKDKSSLLIACIMLVTFVFATIRFSMGH